MNIVCPTPEPRPPARIAGDVVVPGCGAEVACLIRNQEVVGSIPTAQTNVDGIPTGDARPAGFKSVQCRQCGGDVRVCHGCSSYSLSLSSSLLSSSDAGVRTKGFGS